jgi:hypothetical protein
MLFVGEYNESQKLAIQKNHFQQWYPEHFRYPAPFHNLFIKKSFIISIFKS